MLQIPKKMRAVVLPDYNGNIIRAMRSLEVKEVETPTPQKNEILIKVHASPCNPSDIAFIQKKYNVIKSTPIVPGFEGSGVVVGTGSTEIEDIIGKKVSFFTQRDINGPWAEYFIATKDEIILIEEGIDMDQASCMFVNPFTAYFMVQLVLKEKAKSVIINAANGQIGTFIRSLLKKGNVKVINIVRKEEHIEQLKNSGEKYVLDSTNEKFTDNLNKLANELKSTIAFDAVGGEQTGTIFNAMPENSTVYVYGGLSGKPAGGFDVMDIIFKNKKISGYNVNDFINSQPYNLTSLSLPIQEEIKTGTIKTNIQKIFSLEEVQSGLRHYITNMSSGKILFKP
jgi:NADPH:quinone reductase-like Zn-dependent oxidoreductase